MEDIILWFQHYGAVGVFIVSFVESFFSPIMPDLVLIPLAMSMPEEAIYLSVLATVGSVLGGFIGYFLGNKLGLPLLNKYVPEKHVERIHLWLEKYGGWAIFIAAMVPIPYKFVAITSGVFKVNMPIFVFASIIGRGKRFLVEGILIYYYGARALELIKQYSQNFIIGLLIILAVAAVVIVMLKKRRPVKV